MLYCSPQVYTGSLCTVAFWMPVHVRIVLLQMMAILSMTLNVMFIKLSIINVRILMAHKKTLLQFVFSWYLENHEKVAKQNDMAFHLSRLQQQMTCCMVFFWVSAPCSRWVFWRFGRMYRPHLHGDWIWFMWTNYVRELIHNLAWTPKRRPSTDQQLPWKPDQNIVLGNVNCLHWKGKM